ncbi:D-alanyl-D-alanine carboxypeptidase family protein [Lederbergia wuyishanensis]|uniref:D-alanyl-D-alanine carboxypeptidase n=1 Tax=Lederbergia wuyishanensis TaxID=1347903 RepID=A0ABU0D3H6_9BACI|nr:M15 family metallopeptidase [Lederbergia wuyishanensis]MCJ8007878.1 M15 family metallopeptidase [Lederbergia wuyishanensis]MDQ0342955.1 D-alanyl-D-alanine carboxypeptidase [Lederbergia wuyishanensis]
MKKIKWLLLLGILVLLFGYKFNDLNPKINISNEKSKDAGYITIEKDHIYYGNLLLVNHDNPVQEIGVKRDIINLIEHQNHMQGYQLLDPDIRISEQVAERFSTMVNAAKKDHVDHFMINSGFRSLEEQSQLYEEMGPAYALPAGFSEHNLGISLDIGSTLKRMEDAEEGKWLEKNSWKYGFILRYPKDKSAITGIQYEPWHFRYVGLPHSAIMYEKNLTLEQYQDYLKKKTSISVHYEDKKYYISYYDFKGESSKKVAVTRNYEISGDNRSGIIVTGTN